MDETGKGQDRREYFRITDTAAVEIRKASGSGANDQDDLSQFFALPAHYQLLSEFQLLESESQTLLHNIAEHDRNLGAYLKLLNRKLDMLARTLAFSQTPIDPAQIQSISLSEGGLSLRTDIELAPGDKAVIKLILLPSQTGLLLRGQVLERRSGQDGAVVHIAFEDLDEPQRQLIARHILRKQAQERRQRLES